MLFLCDIYTICMKCIFYFKSKPGKVSFALVYFTDSILYDVYREYDLYKFERAIIYECDHIIGIVLLSMRLIDSIHMKIVFSYERYYRGWYFRNFKLFFLFFVSIDSIKLFFPVIHIHTHAHHFSYKSYAKHLTKFSASFSLRFRRSLIDSICL